MKMSDQMLQRFQTLLTWYQRFQQNPATKRWGWIIAGFTFVVAAFSSYRSLPESIDLNYWLLAAALLTVPVVLVLTGCEVMLMGRIARVPYDFGSAIRVTLAGAVANLAPAPGSIALRMASARVRGGRLRDAAMANAVIGVSWVGAALLLAGLSTLGADVIVWPTTFLVAGFAAISVAFLYLRRRTERWADAAAVTVVELLIVSAASARTLLVILALGDGGSIQQGVVVTMSSVLATATGIFPAGLGLAELLAGATATLTGLAASVAIAVSILDRIVRLLGLGILSQILRRGEVPPAREQPS